MTITKKELIKARSQRSVSLEMAAHVELEVKHLRGRLKQLDLEYKTLSLPPDECRMIEISCECTALRNHIETQKQLIKLLGRNKK